MTLSDFIKSKKLGIAQRHPNKLDAIRAMINRFGLELDLECEERSLEKLKEFNRKGRYLDKMKELKNRL